MAVEDCNINLAKVVMSADCSVGANPLAQLNKRVQQDRTLQHGSHVNIHQGAEAQAFKSGPQVSESNKFQMEQFMAGKASSGGNMFMGAGTVSYTHLDVYKRQDYIILIFIIK